MTPATKLTLKFTPQVPLEAACITPDSFADKSEAEISRLPVKHGNEDACLGDFFEIRGNGSTNIVLSGDMENVKHVGSAMTQGRILIEGNVGMHLGAGMLGGEILVRGNVGDWAGAEMGGGKIHVRGNAGHALGAAYRGSPYGMNRGLIIVEGNAGNEVGAAMRRGLIVVTRDAGDFVGSFMIAGTIVVFGSLGSGTGAGMLRGTIITLQPPELLPTYHYDCSYSPGFIRLISRMLRRERVPVPEDFASGYYRRYSGDFNRTGKGEILIYDKRQPARADHRRAND